MVKQYKGKEVGDGDAATEATLLSWLKCQTFRDSKGNRTNSNEKEMNINIKRKNKVAF